MRNLTIAQRAWLGISVFCLVFELVYLHYSFGVTSPFMQGLAAWPLVLGVSVPEIAKRRGLALPPAAARCWDALVATATMGSLVAGIIDIAEAPSDLLWVFPAAAAACGVACWWAYRSASE